jgi:hypothetical protein
MFLLGLGAIALPIWLHRLQTQTPEREPFSSAMLLQASEQRVHLHKRLQFLLLLGLRVALLALLAGAFAKPVLESSAPVFAGDGATLHFIVVDTSFSMGMADRFAAALDNAYAVIDALASGHRAQIIAADNHLRVLTEADADRGRLQTALAALKPGAARLDFGEMMHGLNGLLREHDENIAVHFISDFQAGGLPARFADLIPKPAGQRQVELRLYPVAGGASANWAVESLRVESSGLTAVARGYRNAAREATAVISVNGEERERRTAVIAADGSALFKFGRPELASGDNRVEITLAPADALPGDDTYYAVLSNTPPTPVLLLTADPGALAVTYLKTALATGGYEVEAVQMAELDVRILQRYPWLIIDDLGAAPAPLAAALTEYLQAGGAIFSALGARSWGLDVLPVSGHAVSASSAADPDRFRAAARIDGSHPALANAAGWRSVNISRTLTPKLNADDRVLISLDGGDPLLLEHRAGPGRLLLLTTSLDNTWSDVPVHPVFVSFMTQTARYLADDDLFERQHRVGDAIMLKRTGGASGQVIDPAGRTVLSLADTHAAQNVELAQAGFYEVYTPGRQSLIAVNPDPRESDPRAADADLLARWGEAGASLPGPSAAGNVTVEPVTLELWHGLLLLLAVIVLAESLLANRYLNFRTGHEA